MTIAIAILFIVGAVALALVARDWLQLCRRAGTVEEVPVVRVGDIPEVFDPKDELLQEPVEAIYCGKNKRGKRKDWRKKEKKRRRLVSDDVA